MNVEKYLNGFFKGTKNPSLKAMNFFSNAFDHPEKELKFIHVAGSNGKGSTVEMMTNILICAGFRVGKFISPHLIKYNERISVQNQTISDEEMESLILKIEPMIDLYNSQNDMNVTLFELETTMALLYFKEKKCDFVVLETGLGGLYDCTNIVTPEVSVITSIGYDHMNILGDSLPEIAAQKAGIIKQNSDTVFVFQENDVNEVIESTCRAKNNILHVVDSKNISNYSFDENFQWFDYREYKSVKINLKGVKQIYNASCCIECVDILKNKGYEISDDALRSGLSSVIHKGRFEKICDDPVIVFDGAHNMPAIDNFMHSVEMYYGGCKRVYVISILKTKDYKNVLQRLLEDDNATFIFTTGNSVERYVDKEDLFGFAKSISDNEKLMSCELDDVLGIVRSKYRDCICFIVGSFYVYGSVVRML